MDAVSAQTRANVTWVNGKCCAAGWQAAVGEMEAADVELDGELVLMDWVGMVLKGWAMGVGG